MKQCPFCAAENQDDAIKCSHCGESLQEQQTRDEGKENQKNLQTNYREELKRLGGSDALNYYLLNCDGISKLKLHIIACIGAFILPLQWLIILIFRKLGRLKLGIVYFILIMVPYVFYYIPKYIIFVVASAVFYIVAWVHSAIILHRYQSAARKRILEIDQNAEINIDEMLEKGVILAKALLEFDAAAKVFNEALEMANGNPYLLNLCGDITYDKNNLKLAGELYKKAIKLAKDEDLYNEIKANLGTVGITSF